MQILLIKEIMKNSNGMKIVLIDKIITVGTLLCVMQSVSYL